MLGETPLPAAKRSVFDYLSQKDRKRLQRAAQGLKTGADSELVSAPPPPPERPHIPVTPAATARAALQGFQPYVNEPSKHARYHIYLRSQTDPSAPVLGPLAGQSVSDFNKEAADYASSAAVFKPMSAAMAGRFTSAAIVEYKPTAVEGLHTPNFDEELEESKEEKEEIKPEKEEDPRASAVRLGMYGPMTRETSRWAPARLLCKRFGIKDPHPGPEEDEAAPSKNSTASSTDTAVPSLASADKDAAPEEPLRIGGGEGWDAPPKGQRDLGNIGLGEDEWQAQDVLTYERPSMDVFKAIFASDDEDSADEGVNDDEQPAQVAAQRSVADGEPATALIQPEEKKALVHLAAEVPTAAAYTLATNQAAGSVEKLDLATFRPTFVPREKKSNHDSEEKPGKTKKRKEKERNTLSFGDEDDGDSGLGAPQAKLKKKREKEKKHGKEKKRKREDEDDVWVEKEVSEAVRSMEHHTSTTGISADAHGQDGQARRSRQRAADFM
jgi:G patch domain-containing protein 1